MPCGRWAGVLQPTTKTVRPHSSTTFLAALVQIFLCITHQNLRRPASGHHRPLDKSQTTRKKVRERRSALPTDSHRCRVVCSASSFWAFVYHHQSRSIACCLQKAYKVPPSIAACYKDRTRTLRLHVSGRSFSPEPGVVVPFCSSRCPSRLPPRFAKCCDCPRTTGRQKCSTMYW